MTYGVSVRPMKMSLLIECFYPCFPTNTEAIVTSVQKVATVTASHARIIETGLNILEQGEAAAAIHQVAQVVEEAARYSVRAVYFVESAILPAASDFLTASKAILGGSTTENEQDAGQARISSAPTIQDLQSTAQPRLTTQDPTPSTDLAVATILEGTAENYPNYFVATDEDQFMIDVAENILLEPNGLESRSLQEDMSVDDLIEELDRIYYENMDTIEDII